ncbi:MAG TPA: hypothetical protein VKU80_00965 [Planctomycetota bacterium]|nr:hypothetical protein [Planctomycetota bacterium]
MWRAWGIALLLLSPQDLGVRITAPEHEIAFRPPSGWVRHIGLGSTVAKFRQPGEMQTPAELLVSHLSSSNPTPLEVFKRQARENIKEKYAGSKILEEKDLKLGGKAAYRIVFSHADLVYLKTVVHRSNLEYYMLDASFPPDQADKLKPLVEASISTFEIVPAELTLDERAAESRAMVLLKEARVDPALLGEHWFSIHLTGRKVGHMRLRVTQSKGSYEFESEVRSEFGEGSSNATASHGSFSPDGRIQKLETEEAKISPKQKWTFKATASIDGGQARISRDVNGVVEERTVPVEPGVLFSDVAEILRPLLVSAGKGIYLFKVLSPYSDEWGPETVEVSGLENIELYGKPTDCFIVQTSVGVRRKTTYTYLPDRSLYRVGGPKDMYSVRASTKDEALKP